MSDKNLGICIITCSDTRSMDKDEAGSFLEGAVTEHGWEALSHVVVKDDIEAISTAIVEACATDGCDIVLTCGGTGLSLRDVTPEATRAVCDREVPGIAEGMRAHSLQYTPYAMLSRAVAMQRGDVLVVNLPGSTKAAKENWEALHPVLEHAVKMTAGGGH